jgi:hypothetical protein
MSPPPLKMDDRDLGDKVSDRLGKVEEEMKRFESDDAHLDPR